MLKSASYSSGNQFSPNTYLMTQRLGIIISNLVNLSIQILPPLTEFILKVLTCKLAKPSLMISLVYKVFLEESILLSLWKASTMADLGNCLHNPVKETETYSGSPSTHGRLR